ncbi:unnamed protein product [Dibothriocephalus latus]|uniref:Tetraspanin n=1 Tax=Dibothriocephalus latus TaxID=60516 RepID=A0A3P7N541_DIBLA|nr:unnamed protein product [Dibothriocephalus latus]
MNVNGIIWFGVIFWILSFAALFLSVTIGFYINKNFLTYIFTEHELTVIMTVSGIYGCWLVLTASTAANIAKTMQLLALVIFFLQTCVSVVLEVTVLYRVFANREYYIELVLHKTVSTLVEAYHISERARKVLDNVHYSFDCCGLTQWHTEWWLDISGHVKNELNSSFAWVPESCCLPHLRSKDCGFATPRARPSQDKLMENDLLDFQEPGESVYFQAGSIAAASWYNRLLNEPCPDLIKDYLGELPVYALMLIIALAVGKATISFAALMSLFKRD